MPNLIGHAPFLSRSCLEYRVRRDVHHKMLAEIRREISEAVVTQSLYRSNDSRRVHLVAPGHFPGRQKKGFFVIVQDRSDQLTAPSAQLRFGEANFKRSRRRFVVIPTLHN